MSVTGISSIWFGVTDWPKAKNFYQEVLGLQPGFVNDAAGWASYSVNATDPPIFLIKKHGAHANRVGSHGGIVGFFVEDAAAMMQRASAAGGAVSDKVQDGKDTRVFTIYDPDGNVLELAEKKKK